MTTKDIFKTNLDNIHEKLTEVSDWMYDNPELGFEEFKTSQYLVEYTYLSRFLHLSLQLENLL